MQASVETKVKKKAASTKPATKVKNRKAPSKIKNTKKKTASNTVKKDVLEYYDLPLRYNKTIVKILFQTPARLFVYWDISDEDKQNYIKQYGNNFFESSKPILIVKNKTKNYSFEVEINDFANSWYFNVSDANCDYEVELTRKTIASNKYIPITSSNILEVPNNHILFEKEQKQVFYRNVKTNTTIAKDVATMHFINHLGNSLNANILYEHMYKENDLNNVNNPTSF